MNRAALRALLTERRAAIDPVTHGLSRPTGSGRRAPGLSQEQVAYLLGRTRRAYQELEAGTCSTPSVDLLREVAQLYRMNEHEWIALHRYALGEDPSGPLDADSGYQVAGAWQQTVDAMGEMAYLTDRSWNLLAANEQCGGLFPAGRVPENTMRWMLLNPEAREVLTDWATAWAPKVFPQLRSALSNRPDATLRALEADVLADPVARHHYEAKGAFIHPDGDQRPLAHAKLGPGWVTMCSAIPEGSPGARLMILLFHPGDRRHPPRRPLRA
ncbi:helix-turn-helix domain-containing protein [Streptomyces sp. NPDC056652]|uniref:MmyB family transcriptional regulator n=1 Tax=Streptomyces sp. NPDC056652 TaxID=3345893 RepID=UPI0036D0588B